VLFVARTNFPDPQHWTDAMGSAYISCRMRRSSFSDQVPLHCKYFYRCSDSIALCASKFAMKRHNSFNSNERCIASKSNILTRWSDTNHLL